MLARAARLLLVLLTALGAVAAVGANALTHPSAYVVPTFEVANGDDPIRLTPADLGVERSSNGLVVDDARLEAAVAGLAETFRVEATPGTYELVDDQVVLGSGRPGLELDLEATKTMLLDAIRGNGPRLVLPMREVPIPAESEVAVVVRLSDFKLDLYNGTDVVREYPVGIGKIDYPTPTGAFYVRSKAKNPTWWNPGSAWSSGMPRYMPPGPRNPLGTRALRLDRDAIVIHGTPQPGTIGTRASHGCVRMLREDVEELFELVPEGAAVFILP